MVLRQASVWTTLPESAVRNEEATLSRSDSKQKQDLENGEGALKVGLAAMHVPRESLLQAAEALALGMCHASPRMVANLSESASLNLLFASY
jgi:hypothetical protein